MLTTAVDPAAVLLDTCAVIWMVQDAPISDEGRRAIVAASAAGAVFVSPVSAWEIGLLAHPAKGAPRVQFLPDTKSWFSALMARPSVRAAAFTPDIAIEAAVLPGEFHRDPADRLMVATARLLRLPLVTRDDKILAYAAAGHVRAVAC